MTTATADPVDLTMNGAELLTHSSRSTFGECNRKYFYTYVLGVRPVREPDYFRFGGAYHLGQEILGKTAGDVNAALAAVRERYSVVPDWAKNDAEELFGWMVECETVVRLVHGWHWRWSTDPVEVLRTEEVFTQSIINPETSAPARAHLNAGKRDQLVKHDGQLKLREFKTSGDDISPTSDYWRHLRIDAQISAYYLSYQQEGVDVTEVLYDVVRKPGIRPKKPVKADVAKWPVYFGETITDTTGIPDRESPQMYGARLTADIYERPEFYFARQSVPRLDSDIEEFKLDLWQKHTAIMNAKRTAAWPREARSCNVFGQCVYFDLCTSGWKAGDPLPQKFMTVEKKHVELGL